MQSSLTYKMLRHSAVNSTRRLPSLLNTQSRAFGTVQLKDSPDARSVTQGPTLMTGSEAFVETLVSHGVTDVFGIVGSAFMDALDLFPEAGIRFIPTQHEQNSVHMADGYARISGKHGVCVAQNGPGITNFVTGVAAAYWAHSPVVAITPECGSNTKGMGGFQECDQLPLFSTITKWQGNITNSSRIAEITGRAFDYALYERGPTQINIPRDLFYAQHQYTIPSPRGVRHPAGSAQSIRDAVTLLKSAKNPCILAGGGCMMSEGAIATVQQLAEYLGVPVATTYLHNDSYPTSDPLSVGPLGYQGFESAMKAVHEADVVLAIGSRMNPFGTLPQYDFEYWPKTAKIIQIDIDHKRLGLTKDADVYVHGDANLSAQEIWSGLKAAEQDIECLKTKEQRLQRVAELKQEWEQKLDGWTYREVPADSVNKIKPRVALRELEKALHGKGAIVSTDIGNICSVSNSYLRFDGSDPSFLAAMTFGNCQYANGSAMGAKVATQREGSNRPCVAYAGDGAFGMSFNELLTCSREDIPITSVVFNNGQWGAEKKNQVLWFGDRYIGVNLNEKELTSFSDIARAMKLETIRCEHEDQVFDAMNTALENQTEKGKTTVIEVMCTKELGDPFRRDAMKLPQRLLPKYQQTNQSKESSTGQPTDI